MSGIFGCGSSRYSASLAASKRGILAMAENGGACVVPRCWSEATTWQLAHQRLASVSPLAALAAAAAFARAPTNINESRPVIVRLMRGDLGWVDCDTSYTAAPLMSAVTCSNGNGHQPLAARTAAAVAAAACGCSRAPRKRSAQWLRSFRLSA